MIFKKLKAGALQFAMFAVVVIALLLAAFVIFVHVYKTFKVQTQFTIDVVKNAKLGINYTLANDLKLNDTIALNQNENNNTSIKLHRDYWGLFEKVTSVSNIKNKTIKNIGLMGGLQIEPDRMALYLEDNNRPLVVVGDTKIKGVSYLPKQGVKTGNISGHSYYGDRLIYGRQKTSSTLIELPPETQNEIQTISKNLSVFKADNFIDIDAKKVFYNSFYNPVQLMYSPGLIDLSGKSLVGHIIVQSETKIVVGASTNLKEVILIAPTIDIKNGTQGRFQAFATKEITVGKNCELHYPSTLVLKENHKRVLNTDTNKASSLIKVQKGSHIKGAIAYLGHTSNYNPQIIIDEGTIIEGEVYCNQNIELLGAVYGSIYTSGFVYNQSGSKYQNHIYGGTINANKLSLEYVGLPLNNTKKGIAKWLY